MKTKSSLSLSNQSFNLTEITFIFFIWRLFLFLIVFLSAYILSYRTGSEFTNILSKVDSNSIINNPFFFPWANFDGVHYLSIANYGYTFDSRFFPLYPILIKILNFAAFSFWQLILASALSNLSFLIGLIFLNKLLLFDYSSKQSRKVIINLLVFPTSFFFAAVYSEGLFFLLLILSFYFSRKSKWFWASVTALFLAVTRPIGILILPALIGEYFIQDNISNIRMISYNDVKKTWSFFLIPVGIIFWAFYNYHKWGDWLYFLHNQGGLNNGRSTQSIILLPQTFFRYYKILTLTPVKQFEWWIALLEIGAFVLGVTLLYLAWKKGVRGSYLVFATLSFLAPTLTGTFTGLPRYLIVIFPIFIATALIKKPIFQKCYFSASIILTVILLTFFSRGYYIG